MGLRGLSSKEKDALSEIANIGGGNALVALANLVGLPLKLQTPSVRLGLKHKNIGDMCAEAAFSGDLKGRAVFAFDSKALELLRLALQKNLNAEPELSEVLNIFLGNYFSAISQLLDINLVHSVPRGNIRQSPLAQGEIVMTFRTPIKVEGLQITGEFLLVLDHNNLERLLEIVKNRFSG